MEYHADVLIVTVTKTESNAVRNAFERATGHKDRPVTILDRVYRDLGKINGERVFMAFSEMGSGGLGASQQAVQKGIEALRPRAVIMVGIAFGMDEQKQAIGDILVSQQLRRYELQRVGASKIVLRDDRPHGSPQLLNLLHSAALDWKDAAVHFGPLLTGEKLVDNMDYREQLGGLEVEAIGGEMEGAGLYVACQDAKVDWVLVKAICDWADGNKSQDKAARQKLAAENSAAFVVYALQHAVRERSDTSEAAGGASSSTATAAASSTSATGSAVIAQPPQDMSEPNIVHPETSLKIPHNVWIPALVALAIFITFSISAFFVYRTLTQDQRNIMHSLYALCGGFAAYFLGGVITIELGVLAKSPGRRISASGGIALFIILYFYPPYWLKQTGQQPSTGNSTSNLSDAGTQEIILDAPKGSDQGQKVDFNNASETEFINIRVEDPGQSNATNDHWEYCESTMCHMVIYSNREYPVDNQDLSTKVTKTTITYKLKSEIPRDARLTDAQLTIEAAFDDGTDGKEKDCQLQLNINNNPPIARELPPAEIPRGIRAPKVFRNFHPKTYQLGESVRYFKKGVNFITYSLKCDKNQAFIVMQSTTLHLRIERSRTDGKTL